MRQRWEEWERDRETERDRERETERERQRERDRERETERERDRERETERERQRETETETERERYQERCAVREKMILFPVFEFIDRGEVLTDLIVDHLEGMQKRFQSRDNFDNEGGVNGMDDKGSMREDTKRDDKEEMEGNLLNKLMIRKVTTKMACFGDQSLSCEQESQSLTSSDSMIHSPGGFT
jgi:hypothetical protein